MGTDSRLSANIYTSFFSLPTFPKSPRSWVYNYHKMTPLKNNTHACKHPTYLPCLFLSSACLIFSISTTRQTSYGGRVQKSIPPTIHFLFPRPRPFSPKKLAQGRQHQKYEINNITTRTINKNNVHDDRPAKGEG